LVADLAKHGPPPEENATDEELLLQAWRLWGEACNESLEISASPFTTRPARCFGVCATLWEPGHSSIRTLEKFLRSATFPFWLMAMRPCAVVSIAAIVSRHPQLDWQRAERYAAEAGALRMLYLALQLSESASGIAPVRSLSLQVARWLPQAGFAAPALWPRIPNERAWGRTRWCRISAALVALAHRRGLGERCAGGPLVALGRPPAAFSSDQEVWAGPLSPSLLNRKATKKNRPADDHGPAPEELFSSTTD
jgi:hypothetical protein